MPELQGPFSQTFQGLSTTNPTRGLEPNFSPVFHNCQVSSDGSVVRRGGSNQLSTLPTSGKVWTTSIKIGPTNEYVVSVHQGGITIQLFQLVGGLITQRFVWSKTNVWQRPLTEVNFLTVTTPFNALLITTQNHPPVQVSLLQRTTQFTCVNAIPGNQSLLASFSENDSTLWNDTTASNYVLLDGTTPYTVGGKAAGFTLTGMATPYTFNQVVTLTLAQVTWQWWAESLLWEGKDFSRTVSRPNVTDLDQNIQIPLDLITDLDPRYLQSAYRGITVGTTADVCVSGAMTFPTISPLNDSTWGHSVGARYVPAANVPLNHAPLFITYGARQASGISSITLVRHRELRFNGGTKINANHLEVRVNGVISAQRFSECAAGAAPTDYVLFNDAFTTERVRTVQNNSVGPANYIAFTANGNSTDFSAVITLTNTQPLWLGSSAQPLLYTAIPTTGGNLDGRFINAYGLGLFANYLTGDFPRFGSLYRDRIVFKLSDSSVDQLLISATADTVTPGEYYRYYQVTDALEGSTDDPFTVNVTNSSREPITAILAWQQSLFIFTETSTYGSNPSEPFTGGSANFGLVAAYGAINNYCVSATNLTVLFMNRYGVFDLLNKNNTSDYGAFERSVRIRSIFEQYGKGPSTSYWLTYSPSKNKAYIALPSPTETTTASYLVTLDLATQAWSTVSGAVPFRTYGGTTLFDTTLMVVQVANSTSSFFLEMDAPHYLDFYHLKTTNPSFFPVSSYTTPSFYNLLTPPIPVIPLFREYQVTSYVKTLLAYVANDGASPNPTATYRNYMVDVPGYSSLSPFNFSGSPLVVTTSLSPRPCYLSQEIYTGGTVNNLTLGQLFSPDNEPLGIPSSYGVGVIYTSIYASPIFDLDTMGRLKRLRRLHLNFTTDSTISVQYRHPVRTFNASTVFVVAHNNRQGYATDTSLLEQSINLDSNNLDIPNEAFRHSSLSFTLSGYGEDYQFYVVSVGVEAFKLSAFEFEVTPQREKRYIH